MMEIYNNIFFLIFGSMIKIIDDHYDMNMFDKKLVNIIKILIILSIIYSGIISIEYSIAFLFVSLYSYLANSIDTLYYKLGIILFGIMFIIQIFFIDLNEYSFNMLFFVSLLGIIALILIYNEAKMYYEEYSKKKIISRVFLSCFFFCLFILNLKDIHLTYNFEIFKNIEFIDDMLELTNDKFLKNCYCLLIGYFFTSVLDMCYMYNKNIDN